ncbi:NAD-dependent epimerase/dehydratase family protein [Nostoc punctiforme]|uniref:NAD-dependent epimerase/dehydratase family protein n=1 Tax=Nostoc punctiforme TaxID=272131 RepID=UPI000326C4BC
MRFAELAIAKGMKVRGLQNFSDKAKKAQKLGVEVIVGSVTNPATAQMACQAVDVVTHTAELAKEGGSIDHFHEVNVRSTVNIAKAAKNAVSKPLCIFRGDAAHTGIAEKNRHPKDNLITVVDLESFHPKC